MWSTSQQLRMPPHICVRTVRSAVTTILRLTSRHGGPFSVRAISRYTPASSSALGVAPFSHTKNVSNAAG